MSKKKAVKADIQSDLRYQLLLAGVQALNAVVKDLFASVQAFSDAQKELLKQVTDVETKAEEREAHQALRDQNNVQALTNLRDSTAKAFKAVEEDVTILAETDDAIKKNFASLNVAVTDLTTQVSQLEAERKHLNDRVLDLETRTNPTLYFQGFTVRFLKNDLYFNGKVEFTFTSAITSISLKSSGLRVQTQEGKRFLIVGGPDVALMFCYQLAGEDSSDTEVAFTAPYSFFEKPSD